MSSVSIMASISLIMYIFIFGISLYIAILAIKALKLYIKKNS